MEKIITDEKKWYLYYNDFYNEIIMLTDIVYVSILDTSFKFYNSSVCIGIWENKKCGFTNVLMRSEDFETSFVYIGEL